MPGGLILFVICVDAALSCVMITVQAIAKMIAELEREAYQRGWDDAAANIMAAAKQAPPTKTFLHSGSVQMRLPEVGALPDKPRREVPTIQLIYDVIKSEPGLRGADVFRKALPLIPGATVKTMERTGRTALARLKKRQKIIQRGKQWYPTEN